jgi:hypothetical protein
MTEPLRLIRGERGRFLPGNGSRGRPAGSRNKLSESFLFDLQADWRAHGHEVLACVREEEPGTYLRVVAALVAHQPKAR